MGNASDMAVNGGKNKQQENSYTNQELKALQ